MCAVMGIVLAFFWGYHMFLASINQTTNERFKYDTMNKHCEDRNLLKENMEEEKELQAASEQLDEKNGKRDGKHLQGSKKSKKGKKSRNEGKSKKEKKTIAPELSIDKWYYDNGTCKNVYSRGMMANLFEVIYADHFIKEQFKQD